MSSIYRCVFFVLTLLLITQRSAFGHGYELTLSSNKLSAVPEDEQNFSDHVFFAPLDQFSQHVQFTDHGSVEAVSGINLSEVTLEVQFLGPLWYSNGGTAHRATSDLTMEATSYNEFGAELGDPVDIMGNSVSPGSFQVDGDDAHSIGWELFNSATDPVIPSGAYGFSYRVNAYQDGNLLTPFVVSDPLVLVFNTPDFGGSSLSNAQSAIFSAIMRGDLNLDGRRTTADVQPMLNALANLQAFQATPGLKAADLLAMGDVNQDGAITNADLQALLDLLKSGDGSTNLVPEPSGLVLACLGLIGFTAWLWRTSGC